MRQHNPGKRKVVVMTGVLVALIALGSLTGCGGGNSAAPPGTHSSAPGTYTVKLNATGGNVTQSLNLRLVVN